MNEVATVCKQALDADTLGRGAHHGITLNLEKTDFCLGKNLKIGQMKRPQTTKEDVMAIP
jgi:hypothetical protein